jgi:hypothetical protein
MEPFGRALRHSCGTGALSLQQVRVAHRHGQRAVTERGLDVGEACAVLEQQGRKGMPQ